MSGSTAAFLPQGDASAALCVALSPLPSKPRHVRTLTPERFAINSTATYNHGAWGVQSMGETAPHARTASACVFASRHAWIWAGMGGREIDWAPVAGAGQRLRRRAMAAGGVHRLLVRDCTDARGAPGGVAFPAGHVARPARVDPGAVSGAAALRGPISRGELLIQLLQLRHRLFHQL